jgi:hypothetical protein
LQVRAHTTTLKGLRQTAEIRLVPNRSNLKQSLAKKLNGLGSNFKRIETEYHQECKLLVLIYYRLDKHVLTFSFENVKFQQSKTQSSIPIEEKAIEAPKSSKIPSKESKSQKVKNVIRLMTVMIHNILMSYVFSWLFILLIFCKHLFRPCFL